MMEFNNSNIISGYIKQLLKTTNLPMCRIYTKQDEQYFVKNGVESPEIIKSIYEDDNGTTLWKNNHDAIKYIKNGYIQEYCKQNDKISWILNRNYDPNCRIDNLTKNFVIKNNIYDTYTHEYLGDYLRFVRDYYDVDLMPLYNCFSYKLCQNLSLTISDNSDSASTISTFATKDQKFKIYMLPVKLFKNYTIAIDTNSKIEICCGVLGKYLNDSLTKLISYKTFQTFGKTRFNSPVLYNKLSYQNLSALSDEKLLKLAQHEHELKLFIKVPAKNTSTIVVLEGNYINWNNTLARNELQTSKSSESKQIFKLSKNKNVINMENISELVLRNKPLGGFISKDKFTRFVNFKPITELQLLKYNTKKQYAFADRLIEYLSGNVITNIDAIGDNIARVQTVVAENTNDNISDLVDNKQSGIWDPRIQPVLYNSMQTNIIKSDSETYNNDATAIARNHDILGYVDRDVEATYENSESKLSLTNVDLYPDIYKDDK